MRFLYPLGLIGLIGIPILILIYIIKNKFQEKKIASTYIWNLSQKFMKRQNPLTNITGILALILQVLVITAAAFAIAHPIFSVPGSAENYVLVLDASASMNIEKDGISRFDYAKEQIKDLINSSVDGCHYTVLYGGKSVIKATNNEKDKNKVLESLEQLKPTDFSFSLDESLAQAQNIFDSDHTLNVLVYTDKNYLKVNDNITLISCYREETNHSLMDFSYSTDSEGTLFKADVYAYQDAQILKVDLFVDDVLIKEETTITVKDNPTKVKFNTDITSFSKAECKINATDSLTLDDDMILYQETKEQAKNVLLVSDSPLYLYSALNVLDNVNLTYTNSNDYTGLEAGYDIYVFDAVVPKAMPNDGSIWFVGESQNIEDCGFTIQNQIDLKEAGYLTYEHTDSSTYEKITQNTKESEIAVGSYYQYSFLEDFTPILSLDTYPMLSVKTMSNSFKEVVFSFDLHKSNLPMLFDYPILIQNLVSYSSPTPLSQRLYTCGETLTVDKMPNSLSMKLTSPSQKVTYINTDKGTGSALLEEVGSYTLTVFYDNEACDYDFYVLFPEQERIPCTEEENLSLEGKKEVNSLSSELDNLFIIIGAILIILTLDWGVYLYEQHQLC